MIEHVRSCHCNLGHPHWRTLYDTISEEVYFPGLSCVLRVIQENCLTCCGRKRRNDSVTVPLRPIIVGGRLAMLVMDFTHHKPRTYPGKKSILHVVDHFSKFGFARAVERETADEVVQFLEIIFQTVGVPSSILSDNGAHFKNEVRCCFTHQSRTHLANHSHLYLQISLNSLLRLS